jgi:hypothetical protein
MLEVHYLKVTSWRIIIKDLLNDLSKFEKAAKELGLNPKENKEYLNAEQTYKSLVELSKAWLRVRDNLGQI